MAQVNKDEIEKLTKAFSGMGGFGVEEELIATISQWKQQPEKKVHFRRGNSGLFRSESANFERLEDDHVKRLKTEFARFKNVVLLWAMHPWERDARWSLPVVLWKKMFSSTTLIEIACTRSSEELLGARKAYHALFHHSLEEDVAYYVKEPNVKLLVRLVSSYRYEGPYVNDEEAKLEAKMLNNAIKKVPAGKLVENDDIVRILSTRSKTQLKLTFKHYKESFGKSIEDDLAADEGLQETVLCLSSPPTYFSKMIHKAITEGADRNVKEALTRVMVSRAEVDMKEIRETYAQKYGAKLEDVIAKNTYGNYRDALLSLVSGKYIKI